MGRFTIVGLPGNPTDDSAPADAPPEPPPDRERDDRDVPPNDIDAERAVLGGMLMSKSAIGDVVEVIPDAIAFYRPLHGMIFDATVAVYGRGEPVDALTVGDELTKRGDLTRVGGQAYLFDLIRSTPAAANAGYYAQIVRDRFILRRLGEVGQRIVQMSRAGFGGDVDDIVSAAQAEVFAATQHASAEDYRPMSDVIGEALDEIEAAAALDGEMTGLSTGYRDLDELTHGLHPGQFVIVAARPALGKSVMATDLLRAASIGHNHCTALFSLEMSAAEVGTRILAAEASVDMTRLRSGKLGEDDWKRLVGCVDRVMNAPLYVDASPNMTIPAIMAKCRRLKQSDNLKLVVIDYLQLMSSGKRVESRQQEVSEFSRALKLMAKELEVPVVALCQLNRGPEQRTDKKPMLSDLRESGSLEQDADVVILLHRDDYYDKESDRAGEADFIVAKHRNGQTKTVTTVFQGRYARFVDMAAGF